MEKILYNIMMAQHFKVFFVSLILLKKGIFMNGIKEGFGIYKNSYKN